MDHLHLSYLRRVNAKPSGTCGRVVYPQVVMSLWQMTSNPCASCSEKHLEHTRLVSSCLVVELDQSRAEVVHLPLYLSALPHHPTLPIPPPSTLQVWWSTSAPAESTAPTRTSRSCGTATVWPNSTATAKTATPMAWSPTASSWRAPTRTAWCLTPTTPSTSR